MSHSWLDHHLDRLSIGHGSIAVRHPIELDGAVEDATGLDRPVEDVRQELVHVGADRRGTACDPDVVEEGLLAAWHRLVLGDPDAANRATGTSHADRRRCRLPKAD